MNRNELWRLIRQKEKEFGWAKMKRFVLTVLLYAILICALGFWREFIGISLFSPEGIIALAGAFLPSVLIAIPFVLFSTVIFKQLQDCGTRENKILEDLQQQLNDMDK